MLVLFWLLVPRRWLAPKAAAAGAVASLLVAVVVYCMPPLSAVMAFLYGVGFGLLPVGWTIFSAMLLYNITVETGQFSVVRRSVAGLSGDAPATHSGCGVSQRQRPGASSSSPAIADRAEGSGRCARWRRSPRAR